ncbi:MAG: FAD-dependent oxidoreductase [Lautropia sp.]|nr:FAD-dependent oxidoreductase [Lautropia sp.]
MNTCDVAVVGAGPVGAAAALAFARAGKDVVLIDPRPGRAPGAGHGLPASVLPADPDDWDARVFALSPASEALLSSLGVWSRLRRERMAPVYEMRLFHDADGGGQAESLRLDAFQGNIDHLAHIVEGRHLQAALDEAVMDAGGVLRLRRVTGQVASLLLPSAHAAAQSVQFTLASGEQWQAGLVVAADGGRSPLRDMAGLETRFFDYGQTAVVANFNAERSHGDAAWQWFDQDQGVIALLPLPATGREAGGRVSLVWSAPSGRAEGLMSLSPEALAAEVSYHTRGVLGNLQQITPPACFPLRAVSCPEVIAPGFVMIGDAAHVVHPMAGQGMNLGFGDVASLVDALLDDTGRALWRKGLVPWLLLRRHARARREPVLMMHTLMRGLHTLFGPTLPLPVAAVRNLGWRAVGHSGWVRRQLIAQAIR